MICVYEIIWIVNLLLYAIDNNYICTIKKIRGNQKVVNSHNPVSLKFAYPGTKPETLLQSDSVPRTSRATEILSKSHETESVMGTQWQTAEWLDSWEFWSVILSRGVRTLVQWMFVLADCTWTMVHLFRPITDKQGTMVCSMFLHTMSPLLSALMQTSSFSHVG